MPNHSRVSKPGPRTTRPRVRPVTPRTYRGNTSNSYRNVLQRKWNRVEQALALYTFLRNSNARPNLIRQAVEQYRMAMLNYSMHRMN